MQTLGGSCHDLQALARGQERKLGGAAGGGGLRRTKVIISYAARRHRPRHRGPRRRQGAAQVAG